MPRVFSAKIRDDPIFQRHPRRIERWMLGKQLEFDKRFITGSNSSIIYRRFLGTVNPFPFFIWVRPIFVEETATPPAPGDEVPRLETAPLRG